LATLSRLVIDERIILKCMLRIQDGKAWTGFMWLRMGTSGRILKCSTEPGGYRKCGEFLE
jgi:hypothetical protein